MGHILRRNCPLKHTTKKIGDRRRENGRRQLLDDLKKKGRYWNNGILKRKY